MNTAYFDCSSGVSGDMILGAFLDAGLDFGHLEAELRKLNLRGWRLQKRRVRKCGFPAVKLDVILLDGHSKERKSLKDIKELINKSRLSADVKTMACRIFETLACAEAEAHGCSAKRAHFHEAGDTDSIIDITGAAIAMDYLKLGAVYASAINTGSGSVSAAHGILPIPAPATSILLKRLPVYFDSNGYEMATPTGVAILKNICADFGQMPAMKIKTIGCGAGAFNTGDKPNILRVFIGAGMQGGLEYGYDTDTAVVVQANIDDMNLIGTESVLENIFRAGALDVYFAPVYMKKTRLGLLLTAITTRESLKQVVDAIFSHTTTFGIRAYETLRYKLQRSVSYVNTKYGKVRVKTGKAGGKIFTVAPEYEDCRSVSVNKNIPLRKIYDEANKKAENT